MILAMAMIMTDDDDGDGDDGDDGDDDDDDGDSRVQVSASSAPRPPLFTLFPPPLFLLISSSSWLSPSLLLSILQKLISSPNVLDILIRSRADLRKSLMAGRKSHYYSPTLQKVIT